MARIEAAGPGEQAERWRRLGLRPQGEEGMTYARLLRRKTFRIDWNLDALSIHRRVMGLYPGAVTPWQQRRVKLLVTEPLAWRLSDQLTPAGAQLAVRWSEPGRAEVAEAKAAEPGCVLELVRGVGLVVATGGCPILIREAQLEGKRAATGEALIQQLGAQVGDRLG
jgi:methionyl-tRNA formyltransferase